MTDRESIDDELDFVFGEMTKKDRVDSPRPAEIPPTSAAKAVAVIKSESQAKAHGVTNGAGKPLGKISVKPSSHPTTPVDPNDELEGTRPSVPTMPPPPNFEELIGESVPEVERARIRAAFSAAGLLRPYRARPVLNGAAHETPEVKTNDDEDPHFISDLFQSREGYERIHQIICLFREIDIEMVPIITAVECFEPSGDGLLDDTYRIEIYEMALRELTFRLLAFTRGEYNDMQAKIAIYGFEQLPKIALLENGLNTPPIVDPKTLTVLEAIKEQLTQNPPQSETVRIYKEFIESVIL